MYIVLPREYWATFYEQHQHFTGHTVYHKGSYTFGPTSFWIKKYKEDKISVLRKIDKFLFLFLLAVVT